MNKKNKKLENYIWGNIKMEDKKAQIRLITGIAIIAFGTLAAGFLGAGIALPNPTLSWIGGILMAGIPFILAIISRWIT